MAPHLVITQCTNTQIGLPRVPISEQLIQYKKFIMAINLVQILLRWLCLFVTELIAAVILHTDKVYMPVSLFLIMCVCETGNTVRNT